MPFFQDFIISKVQIGTLTLKVNPHKVLLYHMDGDLIIAPAKIACTPKPITLTQEDGKPQEMVEACLLESDKGIAIVLLNWSDTPAHVPIKNLTITVNNSTTNIPVGSLISSAQGNVVTPELSTSQPPFTISLSQLDYVDVIMIDIGPHLVHTEIVNLGGVLNTSELRPLADVYPFHIIGGHLSLYPSGPGIYIGSVLSDRNYR